MIRNASLPALAALLLVPALVSAQAAPVGAAFAMTNAAAGNEIVAFDRDAAGLLTQVTAYATNGMGTGLALGSHSSLVMTKDGKHLVAVNAGSDEITLFGVSGSTLTVQDKVSSGGNKPVSLALRDDTLYVLNGGNPNEITGFTLSAQNTLVAIPNSTRPLSAAATKPVQIAWSPNGKMLVVTESDTDLIDWFVLDPSTDVSLTFESDPSFIATPSGLVFRGGNHVWVAESSDSTVDMGVVTQYGIRSATLFPETPVSTTETGTSGLALMPNKKFLYASNPDSDSITGLRVGSQGSLQLLDPAGVTATAGNEPADLAITRNSNYLYVLNGGDGTISGWSIDGASGALTSLQAPVSGLPATGAGGLVVR